MSRTAHILALDQGTTSSRALVFDADLALKATAQQEFSQIYPRSGWVEHDPAALWSSTLGTARQALAKAQLAGSDIAAIGITNQRETTLLWDRTTGAPLYNAIVWQDRRTADTCARLRAQGHEPLVSARTGLLLDPYFSGTKLAWMLDHVPGARDRAAKGDLAFGTVDSWLVWHLTGGKVHATDATNASRTMLYDIHRGMWDAELCALMDVPMSLLPDVRCSNGDFGRTDPALFGAAIPICGVAGDQQAAAMGQACFSPGMVKATYGTGCFALLHTGFTPVASQNRLLTTVAAQIDGQRSFALEGAIFVAGAAVQWLRDGLGVITSAPETQELARAADPGQDVLLVPAFTGLGAPWWDPQARGALFGLTRNTGPAELARAALLSVAFQTRDLWEAMRADWHGAAETVLRVDGGMAASDWTMQALADILGAPVDRPLMLETTALGAAWLAGYRAGLCPDPAGFAQNWTPERRFSPQSDAAHRDTAHARWRRAVAATRAMGA